MRALKKISAIFMTVVLCFSIVSCKKNKDQQQDNTNQLVGRWSYIAAETSTGMVLEIREDKTFSSSEISVSTTTSEIHRGTWATNGDQITFTVGSDNVVYKYAVSENSLTMTASGVDYSLFRLVVNPNVVGNWNVASTNVIVNPLKDALELPAGSVNGVELPISIPVTELQGEFVQSAVQEFLHNLTITDTQLQYEVIDKDGEHIQVSKNYSMEEFYMHVSGQVLGLNYNTNVTFPIFESREARRLTMFIQKETVAEMFIGFANVLTETGAGQGGSPEDLDVFRQAFLETFDKYSIVIVLTPRN